MGDDKDTEYLPRDLGYWEENFFHEMRVRREAMGLSQTEFAKMLTDYPDNTGTKFYQATIQRIESGERPVKLFEAVWIAALLNSSVHEMINGYSIEFAYEELVSHIGPDAFDHELERAEMLHGPGRIVSELIDQYKAAVAATSGAQADENLLRVAEAIVELDKVARVGRVVYRQELKKAAAACAALERTYPRSIRGDVGDDSEA
ncbi:MULTISPECIES: helix-turn-helix domain-containing protein [Gordonia]|uniref:HTH cro/C1-type domain-containing protein n=1 Tax=Gordonia sihwensis NBRC 108236 TaxID=1223544 RepID=L7LEG5_9ACTN|nr:MULTISPECIES: helix-turn-helix transcriptional regulator [Gordonia]AUH69784.1 XRE family transcriptional regulator [Gordonia sp. YC-JH1]GAC59505.1 hypothetical protein GSI01S_02_01480 [Gordonia sihwensis NBRC 108236]